MKKMIIAINVEWIKIKGLGLVYLAFILGMLLPLSEFVMTFLPQDSVFITGKELTYSVVETSISLSIGRFIVYILFLYVIIAANRIAQVDHKNNGWQLMETQPVNKFTIYFSKYILLLLLSFLCIFSYFTFSIVLSVIDFYIHHNAIKLLPFDVVWILKNVLRLMTAILGIAAFQLCISVAFEGFIWSFLLGFLGLFANLYSMGVVKSLPYLPYNSLYLFRQSDEIRNLNHFLSFSEYVSLFWMLVFLGIGYKWYREKGIKRVFFKNQKSFIFSSLFILTAAGALYVLYLPKSYKNRAAGVVIGGKFETDQKIDSIKIFSKNFHHLIGSAAVKNNRFFWETKQNLPFDDYVLEFNKNKIDMMMGNGDWFDFTIRCNAFDIKLFVKSNRAADLNYSKTEGDDSNIGYVTYISELPEYQNAPQKFYNLAQDQWNQRIQEIENFTDAENFGLSDEYKTYVKQLLAIRYLNLIDKYRKVTTAYAPSKELSDILTANISKPTPLLSKDDKYLEYKAMQMLNDTQRLSPNPDSILFSRLNAMPDGIEKDRLISNQLLRSLELENDSTKRNQLFKIESGQVIDKDYKKLLLSKINFINLSKKGAPFDDLLLIGDNGGRKKLSQYRGKYVVIDFWTTWCGPCRESRPIFDIRSTQYYHNSHIQFISISLDEDKIKWSNFLKTSPSRVPQYWLTDSKIFMNKYKITGVPRFMIIDPEGKIYSLSAPWPDSANFVDILDKINKE